MKRTGIFFMTIVPTVLAIGFQFLAMGLLLGIEMLVLLLSGYPAPADRLLTLLHDTDFNMMMLIDFALLNIVVFGVWYYHRFEGNYLPDRRTTFHPAIFAGFVLISPAAQFAAGLIVVAISLLSPDTLRNYEKLMEMAGLSNSLSPLTILYAVILGPIGEELIFRGVTMRSARRIFPFWGANLMQAILFGIFHMNIIQGIYAFVLGLILGLVCEKLGSIYYSIFLHICFNFFGTVVGNLLGDLDSVPAAVLYYSIVAATAIAACFLLYYGVHALRRRTSHSETHLHGTADS